MEGGRYHRDQWGRWWWESAAGPWLLWQGAGWVPVAPPHPWWLADPAPRGAPRNGRVWVIGGAAVVAVALAAVLVAALLTAPGGVGSSVPGNPQTPGSAPAPPPGPASAAVVGLVTHVPAAVYDAVGVSSPAVPVLPPAVTGGRAPLRVDGRPGAFFFGAEFCPYCATERWAIVAALSRFGTWSGLRDMASSPTDVYPDTQTFTLRTARFASPYLRLESVEDEDRDGRPLERPTAAEDRVLAGFSVDGYPFFDIGNRVIVRYASFTPGVLAGLSRRAIAAGLGDPALPATQAIVTTANYLSAGICATDGELPAPVCTSHGVTAAAQALHLVA